jgi:hypothetical protein
MNDYEKTIKDLQDRVKSLEERLTPCNGAVAEPLSDDEIFNIGYNSGFTLDHVKDDDGSVYGFLNEYGYIDNNPYFKFVRAIEKAHGVEVKNEN